VRVRVRLSLIVALLVGCAVVATAGSARASRPVADGARETVANAAASQSCPATRPGGPTPPRLAILNFGQQIGSRSDPRLFGNGTLWTVIPNRRASFGRFQNSPDIRLKLPWFRARKGTVRLTAAPVSGSSAKFHSSVGTPAQYGPTGFAPSTLAFGRAGCWHLRATLAGRALTIVLAIPSI
jgi:hypothetical protein